MHGETLKLGIEAFSSTLPFVALLKSRELNAIYKVLTYNVPFPKFYEASYGRLIALNVLILAAINFNPSVRPVFRSALSSDAIISIGHDFF